MIFDKLDLRSQINFRLTHTQYSQYHLTIFWDTGDVIRPDQITDEILSNNLFIKALNLCDNNLVTDISFLQRLECVNIIGSCISCYCDISSYLDNLRQLRQIYIPRRLCESFRNKNIKVTCSGYLTFYKIKCPANDRTIYKKIYSSPHAYDPYHYVLCSCIPNRTSSYSRFKVKLYRYVRDLTVE